MGWPIYCWRGARARHSFQTECRRSSYYRLSMDEQYIDEKARKDSDSQFSSDFQKHPITAALWYGAKVMLQYYDPLSYTLCSCCGGTGGKNMVHPSPNLAPCMVVLYTYPKYDAGQLAITGFTGYSSGECTLMFRQYGRPCSQKKTFVSWVACDVTIAPFRKCKVLSFLLTDECS